MGADCINCGDPDTDRFDLVVRNTSHDEVALCAACHEAISDELADV
jgi:predicted CXXCH cytochrome family protein